MNRSLWRLLLTCLLLLALALKGVAAAGMLACGTGHHAMGGATTAEPPAATFDVDAHDHHGPHGHEAGVMSPHAMDASAATGAAGDFEHAAGVDLLKAKCGGCSPCSMGAVPAGTAIARLPVLPAAAELPAIESHYLSVYLVGFERPPRVVHF